LHIFKKLTTKTILKNLKPTERFSDRVENYMKYRPGYPLEIIAFLKKECELSDVSIIADIGSGTGILSKIFLDNGNKVFAVEPNKEMRNAAEKFFKQNKNFISIPSTAENTELKTQNIDFIIVGQAFHWFDINKTKIEFKRILRNNGYVILIWNSRISKEGFMNDYENLLLKFGTDYENVNHDNIDESVIKNFYSPYDYKEITFPNYQEFDYEGIKGRLLSSSYIPAEGSNNCCDMLNYLENIFEKNNKKGKIKMEYKTVVYYGKL